MSRTERRVGRLVVGCLVVMYPFAMEPNNPGRNDGGRSIRESTIKEWKDMAKTKAAGESMSRDCAILWNTAPTTITSATTLCGAKRLLKSIAKQWKFKFNITFKSLLSKHITQL